MNQHGISLRAHFPYAPHAEAGDAWLHAKATRGEFVTLSLNLTAMDTPMKVAIDAEPLKSAGGQSIDNINMRFVYRWNQAGIGLLRAESVDVGELLLKDDTVDFQDGYEKSFRNWKDVLSPAYVYRPPNVRLLGSVTLNLNPGESRQLWITIHVPPDIGPEIFSGSLLIRDTNGRWTRTIPISIETLSYELEPAKANHFIWYKGTLDSQNLQHYVDAGMYRLQLADIFNHGFRSISIHESETANAQQAIDIAEELGFDRFAIFHFPFPANFNRLRLRKLEPIIYVSDEIDWHLSASPGKHAIIREEHSARMLEARRCGARAMSSFMSGIPVQQTLSQELIPDIVSLYLPSNKEFFRNYSRLRVLQDHEIYYYGEAEFKSRIERTVPLVI